MKKYYHSIPRLDEEGKLQRTGLSIGSVAKGVLLPGDPHRAQIISKLFKSAQYLGRTGTYATYNGKTEMGEDITVCSSGMGCACVPTALEDLSFAGARTVIRVGTAGGVQPGQLPGKILIASGCVRGEGASYELVPDEMPAVASPYVVRALVQACEELHEEYTVCVLRSHDAFYIESKAAHPGLRERMQKWIDMDVRGCENESGTLMTFGHLLGIQTGCICITTGSMFDNPDETGNAIMAIYQDPDFMSKRVEAMSCVAIRAIEILAQNDNI